MGDASFWEALNARAGRLTTQIKPQLSDEGDNVTFGLYFYQQEQSNWVTMIDSDFDNPASKTLFMNKALRASQKRFFHCHSVPLKTGSMQEQQYLLAQLNNIPRNHIHRVGAVRNGLSNFFAVGHLTNIRSVIEATYQT